MSAPFQPSLSAFSVTIWFGALRDRINLQNAAVDKLAAEGKAKMADASRKLSEATGATQKAVDEAARLKAPAAKQRSPDADPIKASG